MYFHPKKTTKWWKPIEYTAKHNTLSIWQIYPSPEHFTQALLVMLVTFRKCGWIVQKVSLSISPDLCWHSANLLPLHRDKLIKSQTYIYFLTLRLAQHQAHLFVAFHKLLVIFLKKKKVFMLISEPFQTCEKWDYYYNAQCSTVKTVCSVSLLESALPPPVQENRPLQVSPLTWSRTWQLDSCSSNYLADPGEARGCSTNTSVIHSLIHSVIVCENIFIAPPRPNGCRWCFQS